MPRTPISIGDIDRTLTDLSGRRLDGLAAAGFVEGYVPLLRLFQALKISDEQAIHDIELIKAGAYAVYGWMPTMLRRPPSTNQARSLSSFVASCRTDLEPPLSELAAVLRTVNGSVVGTSKFLHFARPNIFPIWDSVVAGALGLKHAYAYATPEAYCNYYAATRDWLARGGELPENFQKWMTQAASTEQVGAVRQLELALYVQGQIARQEEAARRKQRSGT